MSGAARRRRPHHPWSHPEDWGALGVAIGIQNHIILTDQSLGWILLLWIFLLVGSVLVTIVRRSS